MMVHNSIPNAQKLKKGGSLNPGQGMMHSEFELA